MIPSGNWSGYPSHRHDVSNPPAELDMEETYFYLFDKVGADAGTPNEGFGFQSVYTPEGVEARARVIPGPGIRRIRETAKGASEGKDISAER